MKTVISIACFVLAACGSQTKSVRTNPRAAPEHARAPEDAPGDADLQNDSGVVAWRELDSKCRGDLAGNDPASNSVCAQRSQAEKRLHGRGICYGKRGETPYQYTWHKCDPRRIQFPSSRRN